MNHLKEMLNEMHEGYVWIDETEDQPALFVRF